MHTTKEYEGPTKRFDAVDDIIEWLGIEKWQQVSPVMAKVEDRDQFSFYASIAGISGFPVLAWYELYHGQGSWYQPQTDGWLIEAGGFVAEVKR